VRVHNPVWSTLRGWLVAVLALFASVVVAGNAPAHGATSKAPKELGPMLFIGDSVGASIKWALTPLLKSGGYDYVFDSLSGRCTARWTTGVCRPGDGLGVIKNLPGSLHPKFAVIELGYNDVPKHLGNSVDEVMNALLHLGVEKVYWINLSERHQNAGGRTAYRSSNEALRKASQRWGSKLTILDWNSASSGSSKTSWFVKHGKRGIDYIHLKSTGQKKFAQWIRDELDQLRAEGDLPGSASSTDGGGSTTTPPPTTGGGGSSIPAKDRPEVKIGDNGAMVKELQQALNQHGAKIWTDGDFGAGTERAVKAFQRKVGLTPDGRVGPKTWKKLGF